MSKFNSGFQKLLSSMVRDEAGSLPRGLEHTVIRTSSRGRNMQSIPPFLMSQYERCKSPGLSQGLAGNVENNINLPYAVSSHIADIFQQLHTLSILLREIFDSHLEFLKRRN